MLYMDDDGRIRDEDTHRFASMEDYLDQLAETAYEEEALDEADAGGEYWLDDAGRARDREGRFARMEDYLDQLAEVAYQAVDDEYADDFPDYYLDEGDEAEYTIDYEAT